MAGGICRSRMDTGIALSAPVASIQQFGAALEHQYQAPTASLQSKAKKDTPSVA